MNELVSDAQAGAEEKTSGKKRRPKFEVREGCVLAAYKFALDPNATQVPLLHSHGGGARAAFNWAVARVKANWAQREAEATYGLSEEELTPWQSWSLPALRKAFNSVKHDDSRFAGWWDQNSKESYSTGLANAAAAFGNWHASRIGARAGARVGFPRFQKKHRSRLSCRFTTGAIRVEADRRHVTLPRLGSIRTHESTRKLQRRLADGRARTLSATVSQESCGRWFVSFQVEVERAPATPARPETTVGVDLGIKHLAVFADSAGQVAYVPNPRHLEHAQAGLRRANRTLARRQGPTVVDPATGAKSFRTPSANWLEAKAALGRAHARVRHLREDALHKLTTSIAREYGTVVVEDLNVAGMLKNRKLARHIADAGFGAIRRHLSYKTVWNGGELVVADRWYPSSKTCSACKTTKAKLSLRERVFNCDACGLVMDRDENAARSLAALVAACMAGTAVGGDPEAEASKARGASQKTRARKNRQTSRSAGSQRAGGATPRKGKEAGPRTRSGQPAAQGS
ncbi:IS607 family element RNA-guided endonuclease TnpB [Streptomyces fagopyri]|uniref:IS607 family element RNA-guided endonuclease TnpB n=1 Tax=Streptomyces fagopyri TaxID=2662397 RepID=UPI0036BEB422